MAVYEIDIQKFEKLTKLMEGLNETFDSLKKVNKELDEVGKKDKKVKKTNKALEDFNGHVNDINSSFLSMVGLDNIADKFKSMGKFGKTFFSSLTSGMGGFIKTLGIAFLKFNAIILVITAITAAVQFFKKAFQFNIGGIQGTFRKLQARFKQLAATIQILFFNYLQKLAPLFEEIGKALEEVMDVLMSPEVLNAFMAIAEVFGNLMKLVLPGLIKLVKLLVGWIKILADLINKMAGWFGVGSNSTTNNNTSNDNRTMNYYTSGGQVGYGQQAAGIVQQLNQTN